MENPPDEIRKHFYNSLAKTRVSIEQCFGILKNRWISLKGGKRNGRGPLRFKNPLCSASFIMACAILHNFLIDERTETENDEASLLDKYRKDLEHYERRLSQVARANDEHIEISEGEECENEINLLASERLNKQLSDFVRFNNLKI